MRLNVSIVDVDGNHHDFTDASYACYSEDDDQFKVSDLAGKEVFAMRMGNIAELEITPFGYNQTAKS